MNVLKRFVQTAKWMDGSPRRCGACLFELDDAAKPASFDVHHNWERIYWSSETHTSTFEQLARSAGRGCVRCTSLVNFLKCSGLPCASIEWFPSRGWNSAQPQIFCHLDGKGPAGVELEICVHPKDVEALVVEGISSTHPSIVRGTKLKGSTGRSEVLAQAARWLDACRKQHKKCGRAEDGFVPTRLLHLEAQDKTRITLCEKLKGPLTYAALSHHWSAETETVILKTTNIKQRKESGIPLTRLPQMMQDVVSVLRGLGIAYLWIDSLCILQDSAADWVDQAAMMAHVYSNADVTVAATWCHGSGQSLFSSRHGSNFLDVDLPGTGCQSPMFVRLSIPHFQGKNGAPTLGMGDGYTDSASEGASQSGEDDEGQLTTSPNALWPLLGRGWVYQEQWLSPRIIHFTKHEIIWTCRETTACECSFYEFGKGNRHGPPTFEETREWEWTAIVEQYCKRDFTQIADRLPALAGIATVHSSSAARGSYLCGLWSQELPKTLFWQATSSTLASRPPMTMPTWSWASTTGLIAFDYPDEEIRPKVLDVQVSYFGQDLMGDVAEAMLRLEGLIVPGTVHYGEKWEHLLKTRAKSVSEANPRSKYGLEIDGVFATFFPDYALGAPGKYFVPAEAAVLCLLFGRGYIGHCDPERPQNNQNLNYVSGIVLRGVSEGGCVHERVGYFTGSALDDALELDRTLELANRSVITLA
ncbi:heterokaryon incompatibility protein-domain-containing protein [Podospora aff. communis PSN243]|uniref:Heterokaryon incompatibility protein-domain-containing protein n=1 Tax=Podospora aff. communis PSN243 TaxID=3040156 RepID=A0AAV9GWD5_9PEZI|nr:heterokaryon incompatibility protein-domain-containing protein [Podospora aff. communis PSN243]